MNSINVEDLLIDFATNIINISRKLSATPEGQYLAKQILRSGLSPAALYAESQTHQRGTDNNVRNLTMALKSLSVTKIWLKIIARSDILPKETIKKLFIDCEELYKVLKDSLNKNINQSEQHILSFFGEVFEDKGEHAMP